MNWRIAAVTASRDETPTARTITLDIPDWQGHIAGQHVDVRLTAADGYSAVRSYSLASAPSAESIDLTVERVADGEVSTYLTQSLAVGDRLEVRGPIGGWFVWRTSQTERVQLIAGGSGLVPLMAMMRTRKAEGSAAPFRLLYSVRSPEFVLYARELESIARDDLEVTYAYTRVAPANWPTPPKRVDASVIGSAAWPANVAPTCYVCGPTPFVEAAAELLSAAGHEAARIRTERFGGTGS